MGKHPWTWRFLHRLLGDCFRFYQPEVTPFPFSTKLGTDPANKSTTVSPSSFGELEEGTSLVIYLTDGARLEGKVLGETEPKMKIDDTGEVVSLDRADIVSAKIPRKHNKVWPALIMGGIIDGMIFFTISTLSFGPKFNL